MICFRITRERGSRQEWDETQGAMHWQLWTWVMGTWGSLYSSMCLKSSKLKRFCYVKKKYSVEKEIHKQKNWFKNKTKPKSPGFDNLRVAKLLYEPLTIQIHNDFQEADSTHPVPDLFVQGTLSTRYSSKTWVPKTNLGNLFLAISHFLENAAH